MGSVKKTRKRHQTGLKWESSVQTVEAGKFRVGSKLVYTLLYMRLTAPQIIFYQVYFRLFLTTVSVSARRWPTLSTVPECILHRHRRRTEAAAYVLLSLRSICRHSARHTGAHTQLKGGYYRCMSAHWKQSVNATCLNFLIEHLPEYKCTFSIVYTFESAHTSRCRPFSFRTTTLGREASDVFNDADDEDQTRKSAQAVWIKTYCVSKWIVNKRFFLSVAEIKAALFLWKDWFYCQVWMCPISTWHICAPTYSSSWV